MKKILLSILILLSVITLTGCKKEEKTTYNKSVVIYFSATGITKDIAKRIANKSNSDIIEIVPKEKYTEEDLDYNTDCRANREQNGNIKPEIENTIDISKYDTIYLGYPIWHGKSPRIILTFLDNYDFSNKVIVPFCTSGSSAITGSVDELRNAYPNLSIKNGQRFAKTDNDKSIEDFIKTYR